MSLTAARGLTLLEVVVAAALLAFVAAFATPAAVLGLRLSANASRLSVRNDAIGRVAERLRSLPYAGVGDAAPDAAAGGSVAATSVVAAVFPHAVVADNTASAFYEPGAAGRRSPAFTTVSTVDGLEVRTTAVFVVATAGGLRPVSAGAVDGFGAATAESLPGDGLQIEISATAPGGVGVACSTTLVLAGVTPLATVDTPVPDASSSP